MIDSLFQDISGLLRLMPSIFVSLLNFFACLITIFIADRFFKYAGLCCYIALSSIIANIQVLYATSYEGLNMSVLLGTVIFCSSFLACDIINEKYGAECARKAVYLAILTDIFFLLNIILTIGHKPLDYTVYENFSISKQTMDANIGAIKQLFLPIPRLLTASYATYLISQLTEIWSFNAIKKVTLIKSAYIKHNLSLFLSSVVLDTFIFTFLGICLLSDEPLSFRDFIEVSFSAIVIRVLCNLGNTAFMKRFIFQRP